jgi:F-type H+-transporting ATPase subunit c
MDPTAAKYIGAGIACIGMGGAGVGVGIIFGNYLAAALRNPSAAQGQFGNLIFGFAITEALGIFSLLIALCCCSGSKPRRHSWPSRPPIPNIPRGTVRSRRSSRSTSPRS